MKGKNFVLKYKLNRNVTKKKGISEKHKEERKISEIKDIRGIPQAGTHPPPTHTMGTGEGTEACQSKLQSSEIGSSADRPDHAHFWLLWAVNMPVTMVTAIKTLLPSFLQSDIIMRPPTPPHQEVDLKEWLTSCSEGVII